MTARLVAARPVAARPVAARARPPGRQEQPPTAPRRTRRWEWSPALRPARTTPGEPAARAAWGASAAPGVAAAPVARTRPSRGARIATAPAERAAPAARSVARAVP